MTERDWRIFREDFNIQYKGNTDILPVRSWDEAKMPQELRKVGKGSTSTCFPVSCWTVIWLSYWWGAMQELRTLKKGSHSLLRPCNVCTRRVAYLMLDLRHPAQQARVVMPKT